MYTKFSLSGYHFNGPLLAGLLLGLCTLISEGGCSHVPYPDSPQWRNGRFENPPDWPRFPTVREFLRWIATRPRSFPDFAPRVVENDGQRLREERKRPSVTWIGHATLLVQGGGVSVLTDPIFSQRISGIYSRFAAPGVALAKLPPIDAVVISHNHRDHLDEASVKALGPRVHFVVPLGLAAWFRQRGLTVVTELDWWQTTEITTAAGHKAQITLVPAQHWSRRGLTDDRATLWGGYVLALGGVRVYFAGDTGYPAAFKEIGRRFANLDYALLPIGAYEPRWFMCPQHISPEDAARAFHDLGARHLIPMHYATFRLSDEPMDEPPRLLQQALGKDIDHLIELAIGETHWQVGTPPFSDLRP